MLDLTPITTPLMETAFAIVGIMLLRYAPRALQAVEDRTGVHLSEQQNQQLLSMVNLGAGAIETKLDQKVMSISHVNVGNEHVRAQAEAVISALGIQAQAMNLTPSLVANMIVGAVDTSNRTPSQTVTSDSETGSTIVTDTKPIK